MNEAKQKAKELVEKFSTKEDALIACDEILKEIGFKEGTTEIGNVYHRYTFWQSVKQEVETL